MPYILLSLSKARLKAQRTAFLIIAREEEEMLARFVPRIIGDLAIAQRPKCARSSAAERPPFPISYRTSATVKYQGAEYIGERKRTIISRSLNPPGCAYCDIPAAVEAIATMEDHESEMSE